MENVFRNEKGINKLSEAAFVPGVNGVSLHQRVKMKAKSNSLFNHVKSLIALNYNTKGI